MASFGVSRTQEAGNDSEPDARGMLADAHSVSAGTAHHLPHHGRGRLLRGLLSTPSTRRCAAAAVELVDGCDHASLMLRRSGRIDTAAASDDVAQRIDELEKALGEGPCLDAIDDAEPDQHLCSDLTDRAASGPRWRADHGRRPSVRGMARLPAPAGRPARSARSTSSATPPVPSTEHSLGPGDHADRLRVGHPGRARARRGGHHPAARAGEQPRDRQGGRAADGDARHRRRPGLRDAGQGLPGDEHQGRRGRGAGRRPPPQGGGGALDTSWVHAGRVPPTRSAVPGLAGRCDCPRRSGYTEVRRSRQRPSATVRRSPGGLSDTLRVGSGRTPHDR